MSWKNKPCTGLRAEGLLLLGLLSYLLPFAGSCSTRINCGVGFKLFVVMVVIQAVPCDLFMLLSPPQDQIHGSGYNVLLRNERPRRNFEKLSLMLVLDKL